MATRCLRRVFLLVLAITAISAVPCQSDMVVVSQAFDLSIPSLNDPDSEFGKGRMEDAIIDVNEHFLIKDLDVAVLLTHDAFFDLEIMLESPAGITITLNPLSNYAFMIRGPDGRYQSAGGFNWFLFDDEAAVGIEDATPPFDRAFRPASGFELSVFDGQDAFGRWRVQIQDMRFADVGRLEEVELIINIPEPASACLFTLVGIVICLNKRGRLR